MRKEGIQIKTEAVDKLLEGLTFRFSSFIGRNHRGHFKSYPYSTYLYSIGSQTR